MLLAILAAVAFVAAVIERARDTDFVELFVWIALGGSAIAAFAGLVALLTGRGRLAGFLGLLLALGANPWVLGRVLEYAASLG